MSHDTLLVAHGFIYWHSAFVYLCKLHPDCILNNFHILFLQCKNSDTCRVSALNFADLYIPLRTWSFIAILFTPKLTVILFTFIKSFQNTALVIKTTALSLCIDISLVYVICSYVNTVMSAIDMSRFGNKHTRRLGK